MILLQFTAPQARELSGRFAKTKDAMVIGVANAGQYLKLQMESYPNQSGYSNMSVYGFSFFSDKQRRWFFANKPGIYRRTFMMARSWVMRHTLLTVTVTNPTPYGPYLMAEEGQTLYHSKTWKTTIQILAEATPGIMAQVEQQISAALGI